MRSRRFWLAIGAGLIFTVLVGILRWFDSGSMTEAAVFAGLAAAIGVAVGLLTRAREVRQRTEALAKVVPVLLGREGRSYLTPGELPPPPAIFLGRDAEFQAVRDRLKYLRAAPGRRRPAVVLIHGEAGVGKSGLVLRVANDVAGDFPDGVVYMSLTAVGQSGERGRADRINEILADLVDSLPGPGDRVPTDPGKRRRVYRRLSKRRRLLGRARRALYVFDDAPDEAALAELMPAGRRSVVVVTSRSDLADLGDRVYRKRLEPLAPPADKELLVALVGGRLKPGEEHDPNFERIVRSAHGYPFALHLAARAISNQGLVALSGIVNELAEPDDAEEARQRMLDLSVKALTPVQRRVLLSLAWLDDKVFVPWMAAAVAGNLTEDEAWVACERLADQRLLERITMDATGVVHLRMPDRVADYVRSRAQRQQTEEEEATARQRLAVQTHERRGSDLVRILADAVAYMHAGRLDRAIDEARGALEEARTRSAASPTRSAEFSVDERRALGVLAEALAEMGGLTDALEIATAESTARITAGLPPHTAPPDQASVRLWRVLGRLHRRQLLIREAVMTLDAALVAARRFGDVDEQVLCLRELAVAESMSFGPRGGFLDRALAHLGEAREIATRSANRGYLESRVAETRALVRLNQARPDDVEELNHAMRDLTEATDLLPPGHQLWAAWYDYHRARICALLADYAARTGGVGTVEHRNLLTETRRWAQRALDLFAGSSHKFGVARSRFEVGLAYAKDGQPNLALPMLEEARETLFFCGDRWVEAKAALELGELRLRISADVETAVAELGFAHATFRALGDGRNRDRAVAALKSARRRSPAGSGRRR
jgi:tetratricopeptide (TPR) repeat protein